MVPNDLCLLVFMPLCSPCSHCTRVHLCHQQNSAEGITVYHFQDQVIKGTSPSILVLSAHSLWGKLYCEWPHGEVHVEKNLKPPANSPVSELRVDSPDPALT